MLCRSCVFSGGLSLESFVKNGIGFLRRLHSACWRKYLQTGIYMECKRALKVNKLRNSDIDNFILPPAYGKRMPERVIELLMAMLPYNPGKRVLDIGHANAMSCHLKMISSLPKPRNITGIDIAPPYYNHSKYYNKSLLADIIAVQNRQRNKNQPLFCTGFMRL